MGYFIRTVFTNWTRLIWKFVLKMKYTLYVPSPSLIYRYTLLLVSLGLHFVPCSFILIGPDKFYSLNLYFFFSFLRKFGFLYDSGLTVSVVSDSPI